MSNNDIEDVIVDLQKRLQEAVMDAQQASIDDAQRANLAAQSALQESARGLRYLSNNSRRGVDSRLPARAPLFGLSESPRGGIGWAAERVQGLARLRDGADDEHDASKIPDVDDGSAEDDTNSTGPGGFHVDIPIRPPKPLQRYKDNDGIDDRPASDPVLSNSHDNRENDTWAAAAEDRPGESSEQADRASGDDSPPNEDSTGFKENGRRIASCILCYDKVESLQSLQLPCTHSMCVECLQDRFKSALREESYFPPTCLCRRRISLDPALPQLTQKQIALYWERDVEYNTRFEHRTYCSNRRCREFILPANINDIRATCHYCNTVTCSVCKNTAHSGRECPEGSARSGLFAAAGEKGWQICPRRSCRDMVWYQGSDCFHVK